ncbi:MAG: prepilin-type N-terminal cleavage/methylation domain-containing protein [Deltaproteobacteria bacterium]|nr:prepilin-type N-terminal cleavage/methylation domain-containing protein [Deltaproteobacteria bacterium]
MALQNNKGFTLAELLVAMGLSAIVMASVGYVYYTQQKTYLAQEQIAGAQQNLRAVLYFMEREIRMAGYDPTRSGNFQIQTANTNTITFRIDLNGNGVLDSDETITYSLDAVNNQLERNGQPLAENIDALDFRYLPAPSPPAALVPLDDDGMGKTWLQASL